MIRLIFFLLSILPLGYFVIGEQDASGTTLTIAKIIQLAFVLYFGLNNISLWRKNTFFKLKIKKLVCYIVYILFITFIYFIIFNSRHIVQESLGILSGPLGIYFPLVILFNKYEQSTKPFLSYFVKFHVVILVFGFIEYYFNFLGIWYLTKHSVSLGSGYVGLRFHSFYGEPRDAAIFCSYSIALSIALLELKIGNKSLNILYLLSSCLALPLTLSVTAVAALMYTFTVYLAMKIWHAIKQYSINIKTLSVGILLGLLTLLSISYIMFADPSNNRINSYFSSISELNVENIAFSGLKTELANILPFFIFFSRLESANLLFLTGSGALSSSSIVTDYISSFNIDSGIVHSRLNPMSAFSRIIIECGVVGLSLFMRFAWSSQGQSFILQVSSSLIIGSYFALRSDIFFLFIYLIHAATVHNSNAVNGSLDIYKVPLKSGQIGGS